MVVGGVREHCIMISERGVLGVYAERQRREFFVKASYLFSFFHDEPIPDETWN